MLTLLLGPDTYSKRKLVEQAAAKTGAELVVLVEPEKLPMDELTSQDLFSKKKTFYLIHAISELAGKDIDSLINSKNDVYFSEEKLDKRSTANKKLVARKDLAVKEFPLPHGREVNTWIQKRVAELGGKISSAGIERLAQAIGRDDAKETKFGGKVVDVQEVFTLEQLENEIQKLIAYANGSEINPASVVALVSEDREGDVLELVNAIGENKKQEALAIMDLFLNNEKSAEEKGKIIQMNALLSEQFRNVALVQDFISHRMPDATILEKTSWKSGRLFIMKKIASRFPQKKILDLLNKLSLLDEELKTGSVPPRVLLDLVMVQLLT